MTDPIGDMLTRIRNASAVNKSDVTMPMSKLKFRVAETLEKEGWIQKAEVVKASKDESKSSFDELKLVLKYKKSGKSTINAIKRISKPGLRVYVGKSELPKVLNNHGIAVISTSQGVMTNKEARKKQLGGEVLCEVY
ncbi:MAG: 30S ribosomal protein S8 [Patescibacteria group bacterium]|jgi:small subunit ribosomal protein S8|nr:30S ribosomal protein S8 [Patescibacteria group bacterium]